MNEVGGGGKERQSLMVSDDDFAAESTRPRVSDVIQLYDSPELVLFCQHVWMSPIFWPGCLWLWDYSDGKWHEFGACPCNVM